MQFDSVRVSEQMKIIDFSFFFLDFAFFDEFCVTRFYIYELSQEF